ncbi:hypothetical protein EW053_06190 [Streptomyces sp. IB2014 016-6]|nr:hypothetical protein EW053_06190 [Streptomyces sp. IB2014 016-6]
MPAARTNGFLRPQRAIGPSQLIDRAMDLGRPMTRTTVRRMQRTQRRPGIDDLVVIASAPRLSPSAPQREPTAL